METVLKNISNLLFFTGFWILAGGGVYYQNMFGNQKVLIELKAYGFFFLPAFIIFYFSKKERREFLAAKSCTWLLKKINTNSNKQKITFYISTHFILLFSTFLGLINKYHAFSADWDLAIYGSACHEALFSPMKGDTSQLADHFEPLLLALTPLCRAVDPAIILPFVQLLVAYLGAFGLFKIARHSKWSFFSSWLISVLYVSCSPVMAILLYDFHPIAFTLGIIPWIYYFWIKKSPIFLTIFILILLITKETTPLTVAGLGLLFMMNSKGLSEKIPGLIFALLGTTFFIVVMKVLYPYFRDGQESVYFAKLFGHLGNTLEEMALNIVKQPELVIKTLFMPQKILYVLQVFFFFAFLPLFRPLYLLPVLPSFAINTLTNIEFNYSFTAWHYQAEILAILFSTSIILSRDKIFLIRLQKISDFVRRIFRKKPGFRGVSFRFIWIAIILVFFSDAGIGYHFSYYRPDTYQINLRNKLKERYRKDEGKKIAAIEKVANHLLNRKYIYLLDDWQKADEIVIAYPRSHLWQIPREEIETNLIPKIEKQFEMVYKDKDFPTFRIWKRKS